MPDLTLAEIAAEGERLLDREHYHTDVELSGYLYRHGPALLAVSKAAVEKLDADEALRLERQRATVDQVALEKAYARHYAGNAALRSLVRSAKGGPDV